MILSDRDLMLALGSGELVISPLAPDAVQPASVDLRLGDEFGIFVEGDVGVIDPFWANRDTLKPTIIKVESYVISPREFLLAHTLEAVRIGDKLVARIEGRSTLGRLGLIVHATAGFVDPGFEGQLTLEMYNASPYSIVLRQGMPVAQLAVERLSSPAARPYGHPERRSKYQHQVGATPPKPLNEKR